MDVVLLSIDEDLRNLLNPESLFNHFSEVDLFYFSIPSKLTFSDRNHLIKQCHLFFQSQFSVNIENQISVENKRDVRKNIKMSRELSWEIFYRFNRWVKVCDGIFDEDLDWFISGYTGKIIDFYSGDKISVFLIAFSGDSISKIPLEHLTTNINNISPFYTFLQSDLFMPDTGPENINLDEKKRIGMMLKLSNFQKLSTDEKFISFSDLLKFWEGQFKEKLVDPVEVKINSSDQSIYQLKDIPYFDERFGIWGTFIRNEKIVDIPLMEILEITSNKFLNSLVLDYQKTMSLLLPN